ncbi:hypothetical protein [Synechococcus sp. KORDI-52]|uniref:hypothetical protein n=1 Tax=Synechococcus sp. KORDI-52 TaxID=585425 RepID=UPI0012EB5ACF|nr:hypothetical protein [Synechococcus sp. KORDI-52]
MLPSRIVPVAPGGEQQEVPGHQACCYHHGSNLLQLLNIHSCIVTLPRAEI